MARAVTARSVSGYATTLKPMSSNSLGEHMGVDPPFEHVRHLRDARRDFAKRLHLFSGSKRVDEERVGAGVGERSDAPQRLIEGFCATRVAPREDDDIPAAAFVAFVARGANARHGFVSRGSTRRLRVWPHALGAT